MSLHDTIKAKAQQWAEDVSSADSFVGNFLIWCDEECEFVLAITPDDYSEIYKYASEAWAYARREVQLEAEHMEERRSEWQSRQ